MPDASEFEIDEGTPKPTRPKPVPIVPMVAPAPSAPATTWSFVEAVVVHNENQRGIMWFFAFAAAWAWFAAMLVGWLAVRLVFFDGAMLGALAVAGAFGWWFWGLHRTAQAATAERRIAYGLPSAADPTPIPPPPFVNHQVGQWILAGPKLAQQAWQASTERIVLDPAGIEAGDAAVARLGRDEAGKLLTELNCSPAGLDALEVISVTERVPASAPVRVRLRPAIRDKIFPPKPKNQPQNQVFANVKR